MAGAASACVDDARYASRWVRSASCALGAREGAAGGLLERREIESLEDGGRQVDQARSLRRSPGGHAGAADDQGNSDRGFVVCSVADLAAFAEQFAVIAGDDDQ